MTHTAEYDEKRRKWLKDTRKVAKKLGVSTEFLRGEPHWVQEGRAPTIEEFTDWARNQHKRACKEYKAAFPLNQYNGRCTHHVEFKKSCVAFFSHTGICESGMFVPERMPYLILSKYNKQGRKADREVRKVIKGTSRTHHRLISETTYVEEISKEFNQ